jgi:hypothetical protein
LGGAARNVRKAGEAHYLGPCEEGCSAAAAYRSLSVTLVWVIWLANRPTAIERAVLSEAEAGAFPLEGDFTYDGQVECRVEGAEAFHGQGLFICRLGLNGVNAGGQYVYAALVDGVLHTPTRRNPTDIPARAFDPGF